MAQSDFGATTAAANNDAILELEHDINALLDRRGRVLEHKAKAVADFDAREAELMRRVDQLRSVRHGLIRERDAHAARERVAVGQGG